MAYWLLFFAVLANFLLSVSWYSQRLFGSRWLKRRSLLTLKKVLLADFLGGLLMAVVLFRLLPLVGASDFLSSAVWGFVLWLGFVLPADLAAHVFYSNNYRALIVISSQHLFGLVLMSIIISAGF